jgi:gluconolactonase
VWTLPVEGGEPEEFARMPAGSADGLAVDVEGGVWVALGAAGGSPASPRTGAWTGWPGVPTTFVSSLSFGGGGRARRAS